MSGSTLSEELAMSTLLEPTVLEHPKTEAAPPFVSGMRMSRAEFRHLRELYPEINRVERLEGVVDMPAAAVRSKRHGRPHSCLVHWLGAYEVATRGVESMVATTVAIGDDHDPEPDALLYVLPEFGGSCRFTESDYLEGSPELLGEVAGSTAPKDLGVKLRIYEENGVEEYLVWLTETSEIRWFRLRDGRYARLEPDAAGIIRSEIFPGLWLDVAAMLRGDMPRVLAVLQLGLATPEHAAFVQRLGERQTHDGAA